LGGGISGLSAAWFLRKKYPKAQVILLEKTNRLGGAIQTSHEHGLLFEKGPRTFQSLKCPRLLQLIRDVGLEGELIYSPLPKRYLWHRGKLRSPFFPTFLPALLREPFRSKWCPEDESIYDFAVRRFNHKIAVTLFDPLTLGIYAGDIKKLSIRSCFPKMREGSVLFSMQKGGRLFTLSSGMSTLIDALAKQLDIEIVLNCSDEKRYKADRILSALPSPFEKQPLTVVNLAFAGNVLSKQGFGYLVPTSENEKILGMIWDSSVFPQQNRGNETRMTAMMRSGSVADAVDAAKRHLGIAKEPIHTSAYVASIPQFNVGYYKQIAEYEKNSSSLLLGNYLEGPSVEACIQRSYRIISTL
jgi:oxygen-dependent protoporphyrinogen oxidase